MCRNDIPSSCICPRRRLGVPKPRRRGSMEQRKEASVMRVRMGKHTNACGCGAKRAKGSWQSRSVCRGQSAVSAMQTSPCADPLPGGSTDTRGATPPQPNPAVVSTARVVGVSLVSFASVQTRKLIHYATPPLRITNASLVCDSDLENGAAGSDTLCGERTKRPIS